MAGGVNTPGAGHGEYGERYGHGYRQESLNSFAGVVKFTDRGRHGRFISVEPAASAVN